MKWMWGWMGTGAQRIGAIVAALFGVIVGAIVDQLKSGRSTEIHEPQPGRREALLRKLNDQRFARYKWVPDPRRPG